MEASRVLFALVASGLIIVLAALFARNRRQQLLHAERMAALEKGVAIPVVEPARPWSPRVYLLRGLIWSFSGAAIMICLLGLASANHRHRSAVDLAVDARRVAGEANISQEEAMRLVQKDAAEGHYDQGAPDALALLGLIPLGVGIAYLVFYYTGERQTAPPDRSILQSNKV